jgi:hypothetical protein
MPGSFRFLDFRIRTLSLHDLSCQQDHNAGLYSVTGTTFRLPQTMVTWIAAKKEKTGWVYGATCAYAA